jgi:hypothetical protein
MTTKSVTVLIPWCNRDEVIRTLSANSAWLRQFCEKVVLVNCAGSSEWLRENLMPLTNLRTVVLEVPTNAFNKSLAINLGLTLVQSDLVLILDADIIIENFFPRATHLCEGGAAVTLKEVRESDQFAGLESELSELSMSLRMKSRNSKKASVNTSRFDFLRGSRSAPAILLALRKCLFEVNGLNSQLLGWGWEDIDLLLRLQMKCGLRHRQTGRGVHITHSDRVRYFGPFSCRTESQEHNSQLCIARYQIGDFDGSLRRDLQDWRGSMSAWSI